MPTTRSISPAASRAAMSARAGRGVAAVTSAARRPRARRAGASAAACCSARISVGAISATWRPDAATWWAAASATAVLPAPTSPWSRRLIGSGRARSAAIASMARRWRRGQAKRQHALEVAAHIGRARRRAIVAALAAALRHRHAEQEQVAEHQPPVPAAVAAHQRVNDVVGERVGRAVQRGQRLGQGRQALARLHLRRHAVLHQAERTIDGGGGGAAHDAGRHADDIGVAGQDAPARRQPRRAVGHLDLEHVRVRHLEDAVASSQPARQDDLAAAREARRHARVGVKPAHDDLGRAGRRRAGC